MRYAGRFTGNPFRSESLPRECVQVKPRPVAGSLQMSRPGLAAE